MKQLQELVTSCGELNNRSVKYTQLMLSNLWRGGVGEEECRARLSKHLIYYLFRPKTCD